MKYLEDVIDNMQILNLMEQKNINLNLIKNVTDKKGAIENLKLLPSMKNMYRYHYIIGNALCNHDVAKLVRFLYDSELLTDNKICWILNYYLIKWGNEPDFKECEVFADILTKYLMQTDIITEEAVSYDLKLYYHLETTGHERLLNLLLKLGFSNRKKFLLLVFANENWKDEIKKYYIIEELPQDFTFNSSKYFYSSFYDEDKFASFIKMLNYPGAMEIYKLSAGCSNLVVLKTRDYSKEALLLSKILERLNEIYSEKEVRSDIKPVLLKRLTEIDYREKLLSGYLRFIKSNSDEAKECLSGSNSFLSGCTGNRFSKLMENLDSLYKYPQLVSFARECLAQSKYACLRLMQENLEDFINLPKKSILFDKFVWQKCNVNTLTLKDLRTLQKRNKSDNFIYTSYMIQLSNFGNDYYTFPEFFTLALKGEKIISFYDHFDPAMRVDEKLRRIRQLCHESISMDDFPHELIKPAAEALSKETLADFAQRHRYLKEADLFDFLYLESIEAYDPEMKLIIEYSVTNKVDILTVIKNYNNPKLKEVGLKKFQDEILNFDEDSKWLYEILEIPEEYLSSLKHFCLEGNDSITRAYYKSQEEEGKRNILLLAKAEIYQKLEEVKYENFNAEIGFDLNLSQKEIWEKNQQQNGFGFSVAEYTDFKNCMRLGEMPVRTCMNYKDGAYNECLLSVFDANKKILYVKNNGKIVARAIMRLTKMSDVIGKKDTLEFRDVGNPEGHNFEINEEEKLVVFLEKMYYSHISGKELHQVEKLLLDFAKHKAETLGATLLIANAYNYKVLSESRRLQKVSTNVYISKSKNGKQYLDSLGGNCESGGYYMDGNFYTPLDDAHK